VVIGRVWTRSRTSEWRAWATAIGGLDIVVRFRNADPWDAIGMGEVNQI